MVSPPQRDDNNPIEHLAVPPTLLLIITEGYIPHITAHPVVPPYSQFLTLLLIITGGYIPLHY